MPNICAKCGLLTDLCECTEPNGRYGIVQVFAYHKRMMEITGDGTGRVTIQQKNRSDDMLDVTFRGTKNEAISKAKQLFGEYLQANL